MEFSEIAFKMFKAEIKKYRVFILCNVLSIGILYSFISIVLNKTFMDNSIVDPMISGNIYAPTFMVVLFVGIFIPYAQSIFIKSRQKDYGILLTLGMSENEVTKWVLIENITLGIVSLIIGLIFGTILSVFFLYYIRNGIGIAGIDISISIEAYKVICIYVIAIFLISILFNLFRTIKSTIYEKIKFSGKLEYRKRGANIKLIWLGIIFNIIAFGVMVFLYRFSDYMWFISIFFSISGSFLIFFNGEAIIQYIEKKHYKKYIKNVFVFSDLKFFYSSSRKIFFVTTWLFFSILFFLTFSFILYPSLKSNVDTYHKFDMAYAEIQDGFVSLQDNEIENIVNECDNSITEKEDIDFVRQNVITIFCVDDINRILDKEYKVKANECIYVYPYDLNDGYNHTVNSKISFINIKSKEETRKINVQDRVFDPLLGNINCISDNIILVNREDYNWISSYSIDYYIKGKLKLYNFKDWMNSEVVVNRVSDKLLEKNNMESSDKFYSISSKIEAYKTASRSAEIFSFTLIYVTFLLYLAAIIMIHFKFKMELVEENKRILSLYRIGIRVEEIKEIMSKKVFLIFFVPFIYSLIINIIYSYWMNSFYGYGEVAIKYGAIFSIIFSIVHFLVYKVYFNFYIKRIIRSDKLY